MEGISTLLTKTKTNMAEHVSRLERDLATIRTGRASAGLLENIRVDYYGTQTPIKQMAVINVLDAKTLEIQPWDISSINENISKMSEDFKVAVRNERRDVLEKLKKAQKAAEITEDDLKRYETDVQKATDANIAKIEQVIKNKEAEIMKI